MKKRGIAFLLSLVLIFSCVCPLLPVKSFAVDENVGDKLISASDIPLRLYYDEEASHGVSEGYDSVEESFGSDAGQIDKRKNDDWERWSIPLGNGYFGANIFGRTETERIQLTDKTLANPYYVSGVSLGGVNNFSETYIDLGHTNSGVTNYSRELDLKTAISTVSYKYNGVTYTREYFTSYPDNAMVIRLDASADGALGFTLRPTIPFEQEYMNTSGDRGGKTGEVTSSVTDNVGTVVLSGKLEYFDVDFYGLYRVYTDGTVTATSCTNADGDTDGTVTVSGATSAYIVITLGTDYELSEEVFTSSTTSKPTFSTTLDDAKAKVEGYMNTLDTVTSGQDYETKYATLKSRHITDYENLFGRVSLELNCKESDFALTTDRLLENYKNGSGSTYLETLYFQYGRYLLIASSREGALPANLQGTWNRYNKAPWSSGYWHNINVQMNYWPAFSTNLAETFESYIDYNAAYMAKAEQGATSQINNLNPSVSGTDGGNGWSIDTGAYPYDVHGSSSIGNLGFTTQLFWEYYEYTQDKTLLETVVYPVLVGAARFITKMVKEDGDGNYLAIYTDSPEQYVDGVWYYTDKGTAYAQSFAYQNNYNTLLAAKELGISFDDTAHEDYAILQTVLEQLDRYDPVRVGLSGQVKEFFEEDYYGDLGEYTHRHISQLVGLYPGNIINSETPAWLDAAIYTLTERGDEATGWGVAHRLNLWARVQDGERAHDLLAQLLKVNTATNLWDLHPPFQIDGNLGGTAGIAEMLLQSHAGYIEPLAAIPTEWASGSYTGLVARGNFEVAAAWADGLATAFNIKSLSGGTVQVKYAGITDALLTDASGTVIEYTVQGDDIISFETTAGTTYVISGFTAEVDVEEATDLVAEGVFLGDTTLSWAESSDAAYYNVYVAKNNAPAYTLIGSTRGTAYVYSPAEGENARLTFAVTAVDASGNESDRALAYRNPDNVSANVNSVSANVIDGKLQVAVDSTEYAANYRLYTRASESAAWTLLTETSYPIILYSDYDSTAQYGVSAVNYFGEESDVSLITSFNQALDEVDYTPSNIFLGLKLNPSDTAKNYVHNSAFGDYGRLTDGDLSASSGRFSTKASAADVLEATINLPTTFLLGELQLFDYNGTDSAADYAGGYLRVEAAVDGEWKTVAEYSSNAEIIALRKSGTSGKYIGVDLSLVEAQQIKIYISNPIVVGVEQKSLSFNEIQCTGIALNKGDRYSEPVEYDNILSDKTFVGAINSQMWYNNPERLTDGDYWNTSNQNVSGVQSEPRYATLNTSTLGIDVSAELGAPASLGELRIKDHNGWSSSANYAGNRMTVQVMQGGNWVTVYDLTSNAEILSHRKSYNGSNFLIFDMGGVYAEAIRVIIPERYGSNYIALEEIECSGYYDSYAPEDGETIEYDNILSDKTFVGAINSQMWYNNPERLTDGDYWNTSNQNVSGVQSEPRYATLNTSTLGIDVSAELGALASLGELRIKDHNGWSSSANYAGNRMTIQVMQGDNWVTVYDLTSNAEILSHRKSYNSCNFLIFDMGGVYAEAIRVIIPERYGSNYIALEEIECSATVAIPAWAPSEDESTNILLGTANDKITISGAKTHSAFTGKEYQLFDGDRGTRHAVQDAAPYSYSIEVELNAIYPLYTLRIYPFHNANEPSRSDDTSVEVCLGGVWVKVADGVTIANSSYTDISLGGVKAEKIRVTFANTTWGACASIWEMTCTTGTTNAVDRTELLEAYKALESVDISGEFGFDTLLADALKKYKAYLGDTKCDSDDVAAYVEEIRNYTDTAMAGTGLTDAYDSEMSFNLSLAGDIALNLYYNLADDVLSANPDAFVIVEQGETSSRVYLSELTKESNGSYKLSVSYAAAQMTDTVTMRLFLNDSTYSSAFTGSVAGYAERVLSDADTYEAQYPGITALLEAMLNYGGYAQTYFNYNTDNMANEGITAPELDSVSTDKTLTASGSVTGIVSSGWTLSLESETHIKLVFSLKEGYSVYNYSFTVTDPAGNTVEAYPVELMDGYYYVKVENIPAAYLDNDYTVVMSNTLDGSALTLNISAECYLSSLADSADTALVNLVKAMKLYNEAANVYFGK